MTSQVNAFRIYPQYTDVGKGKDAGTSNLAQSTSFAGMCVAEYVWIDGAGNTRCKSKTVSNKPEKPDDCGLWVYDGSSTGQADGGDSDVYLVPRAVFDDPMRGPPNVIVLCEAVTSTMDPAPGNYRAACAEQCAMYADSDPWFGIEQEYTLMKKEGMGVIGTTPIGFNEDGSPPAPQGPYYCSVGTQNMPAGMRALMDEHYAACIACGVKITGTNGEVMPGQGEFQIGPCRGVEIGDHMYMARHLLVMIAEKYDMCVSFHPKPTAEKYKGGDWNGAGCHTNFSTKQTRSEGGLKVIEGICRAFGRKVKQHMKEYGEGNELRLTGKHETADMDTFSFGVADRGSSIRIPRPVGITGKGYMEDRRPAGNCCPYRVAARMMESAGDVLNTVGKAPADAK